MKRTVSILAAAALMAISADMNAGKAKQPVLTPASDTRIEYTGRITTDGEDVSFDWSGVYLRVRFKGPYIAMKCSDTKNCWFNLWIDREMGPEADRKFLVGAKDTLITLAEGLGKGEHEIILQKRTEGEQGRFTIHSFLTQGDLIQAKGRRSRHIEFIGDSYTCGFGTESSSRNDPFEAKTENCNLTYAAIVSRYFNADYNLVSHSGQGIVRNYDDYRPGYNIPDRYTQAFDEDPQTPWNPETAPHKSPDIVVIYLGTNDFSTGKQPVLSEFVRRYVELLGKVKAHHGEEVPVLCIATAADPAAYDYVRTACQSSGMKNITYMSFSPGVYDYDTDLGACWHPNYRGHLKWASCVIPYIATATGWEMEEKTLR